MKKVFSVFVFLAVSIFLYSQDVNNYLEEIKTVYIKYAEGNSIQERLNYVFQPDVNKPLMEKHYKGKKMGYTPSKFGSCYFINGKKDLLCLEEFAEGSNIFGKKVQVKIYRYIRKINNIFKVDWQASVCYNKVSLTKLKIAQDEDITTIRCLAQMEKSYKIGFYCFNICDYVGNYVFTAYTPKDEEYSTKLFDIFEDNEKLPVLLKIRYSSEIDSFLITDFIQQHLAVIEAVIY